MSLYFYSFFIFGQLSMLSMVVRNYQEAKANHEILEEIKTLQPEPNYSDLQNIGHIKEIKFDDVSF
jgi:ABC-type bacteriocin/lantibiotic exporter with double-glycine peptidase domain